MRMLWLNDLGGGILGERIVFLQLDGSSKLGRRMRMLFGLVRRSTCKLTSHESGEDGPYQK